jgi:hypothetical protein
VTLTPVTYMSRKSRTVVGASISVAAEVRPFALTVRGRASLGLDAVETSDALFDRTFTTATDSTELLRRVLDAPTRGALIERCGSERAGQWLSARGDTVRHEFPLPRTGLVISDVDVSPEDLRRLIEWTLALADRIAAECAQLRAAGPAVAAAPAAPNVALRRVQLTLLFSALAVSLLLFVGIFATLFILFFGGFGR